MRRPLLPAFLWLTLLVLGLVLPLSAAPTAATHKKVAPPEPVLAPTALDEGELEGARFAIARPTRWNGTLLLLAHGYRAESAPLIADLSPWQLARRTLLAEGWMIASTSYRRNGIIIADALTDLDNLRAHIAKTYGQPKRVLLEGSSMGGLIVALIAERPPENPQRYHGAIAIGAALQMREPGGTLGLSLGTQLPLIFLTNRSELAGPRSYVIPPASLPPELRAVAPVLFRVNRDGHVNVNQLERLATLRTLNAWLDQGPQSLPQPTDGAEFFDATHAPEPGPSQVLFHVDRQAFTARVTEISAVYGNVTLNAQPADFIAIGIVPHAWFKLTAHDQSRRVLFGAGFDGVKRGEWIAFPSAEGFSSIARSFENAATTAALKVGDEVRIESYRLSNTTPDDDSAR